MDSASPEMLALASEGHPLAISAFVQLQLGDCDVDITGWKREGLLHLELLAVERPNKVETLRPIRQALADLAPSHLRAVQVSAYMYGHEDPCWMERLALKHDVSVDFQPQVTPGDRIRGVMAWAVGKSRWIWVSGGVVVSLLAIAAISRLGTGRQVPEMVQEQSPIRSRSGDVR